MLDRNRTADALDLWRAGERHVTRWTLAKGWRADYQAAVDAALAHLQRYSTLAELLTAYFDLDNDAWLDVLCRRPSGRILNVGDVEDAAYWRRAQQLSTGPPTVPANGPVDTLDCFVLRQGVIHAPRDLTITVHIERRGRRGRNGESMPVNADKSHLWKADVTLSVDLYNSWFLAYARGRPNRNCSQKESWRRDHGRVGRYLNPSTMELRSAPGGRGARHVAESSWIDLEREGEQAMAYAHSRNDLGQRQDLVAHLRGVADLAAQYCAAFGAAEVGYLLGLWHDLGKFNPRWQQYLLASEQGLIKRGHGPDHKAVGAQLALSRLGPTALCVQGHHGGLKDPTDLRSWLKDRLREPGADEALAQARQAIPSLEPASLPTLPLHVAKDPLGAELFLRLLFSALVDADFLDTEGHASRDRAAIRGVHLSADELWQRFAASHSQLVEHGVRPQGIHADIVHRVRAKIYQDSIDAAGAPPGMFRLSAPTGGGKTRAGMAFALQHALRHGQQRVIVAVPFITITEQTAQVYGNIFGADDQGLPAVLEHHSGAYRADIGSDDFDPTVNWSRLAAENWDAPIIVTTTVQLFESLFSAMTSRARKVHRLANSVIILDEAQALPPRLLKPILDALQQLCRHYHSSVVISTATQPAFEVIPAFRELNAREIVDNPGELFGALRRVSYDWRTEQPLDWEEIAALLAEQPQGLAILNTKRDARMLLDALADPDALHLSTSLCGMHRRRVINTVQRRLAAGERCRLVSTQVVEAGVDIDFPLVLRAIGPLDSIIQAAGRCNREGRLDRGHVIVFDPADGGAPQGAYQIGIGITRKLSGEGPLDPDDPAVARRYFQLLYETLDADPARIQELRQKLQYPEVERAFRMIDDESDAVVVEYGTEQEQGRVRAMVEELRAGTPKARALLRHIQPYTVAMRNRELEHFGRQGLVSKVIDGVWQWHGEYDEIQGVTGKDLPIDRLVF